MSIQEVDFNDISQYKNTNVIPVFMKYGNEYFEIVTTAKQIENAWATFQKIFYYKYYSQYKEYLDKYFGFYFFAKPNISDKGKIIFSNNRDTFYNKKSDDADAVKFAKDAYVYKSNNKYNNLFVLKKFLNKDVLNDFKLFVSTDEQISSEEFEQELSNIKNNFKTRRNKPCRAKKGSLVVGHINGIVLTEQEKLINYVKNEFKRKKLIGDITLTDEQEKELKIYMKAQLENFNRNCANFKPKYGCVFALGLVRYSMKYYNAKGTGDFWPYFNEEYNVKITPNNQRYIHTIFKDIMKKYGKIYSDTTNTFIDNITMHSFVADHSANKLFDYLFDFWRLDLYRNAENLNNDDSVFDTLIEAMKKGTQNVMSHTSLLLSFDTIIPSFKNRTKRILKLINNSFWTNLKINETGNRINHLLNEWINKPNGVFQKEKSYVSRQNIREKGEILFHSPTFKVNYYNESLEIILPQQRLIDCDEQDEPKWIIRCSNQEFNTRIIETNGYYKHDKISCYVEKILVNIPLKLMLSEFNFVLRVNGNKEIRKYKIEESKIRFFDEKGKYIDHNTSIIPSGYVTAYSDNESYPVVLEETYDFLQSNGLIVKTFNLKKGQIVTLDDLSGIQVGQKITEGLTEVEPVMGAELVYDNNNYKIYAKLPKLLFKANSDELQGISLIINGNQNRIIDKPMHEFKILDDLSAYGYLIDLKDYISEESLYHIALSYPRMHTQNDLGFLAYIKDFSYEFEDAPYVFKEYGKITFYNNIGIDRDTGENEGLWKYDDISSTFSFNFGERNEKHENYCHFVKDNKLILNCIIGNNKYPISFEIPALYWRFEENKEWNTKQPNNILLKNLKNQITKLFVKGPFNFSKAILSTTDDVDTADEESTIKITNETSQYFDVQKIYEWFRNDRNDIYRKIFITLDDNKIELFNVICKSKLNDVILIGDYENNILNGILDIDGNEDYSVSICHNGNIICEDERVVDKSFSIDSELNTGNYEIYVYEISEEDDGFDVGPESILLNQDKKAIVKNLINIQNLENNIIVLDGYKDIENRYVPNYFNKCTRYVITNLKRTTYNEMIKEENNSDCIYGIWNENIDINNEQQMSSFIYYRGKLKFLNKQDCQFSELMNVIVLFTDKLKVESILILAKDADGEYYCSLFIDKTKNWILSSEQYKNLTKEERKKCECFWDDEYYYLTQIKTEEEKL